MGYRTHDSLITFNNGLGPLKTKSGGGCSREGVRWGDVLGGDFVLRGPNTFIKVTKLSCVQYHMVESRSLNGPLVPLNYYQLMYETS